VAEYLKPLIQSTASSVSQSEGSGTQEVNEQIHLQVDESGGFSIPLLWHSGGGTEEERERKLNSYFQSSGIEWTTAQKEQSYKPHRIRVYKLAQGYDTKKIEQNMVVALGKGPFDAYIRDAAVPKWLTEDVLKKALDGIPPPAPSPTV